jgi:hypothetical protein
VAVAAECWVVEQADHHGQVVLDGGDQLRHVDAGSDRGIRRR